MFKTIATSSLRPGMFLHGLNRHWLDHPFWKTSFVLSAADIDKIVSSGIASVVIDTDKGLERDMEALNIADRCDALNPVEATPEGWLPIPTRAQVLRKSVADEIEHAKRLFES